MTKDQLKIFQRAFKKANNGKVALPNKFDLHKITELEFYTDGMRGGRSVRFFVKEADEGNWVLDFFAGDDYSSSHKRILHDGTIVELENLKGQYGRPNYPDDPERTKRENEEIKKHNDLVHSILVKKGLKQDLDNPEFEETNVIRVVHY